MKQRLLEKLWDRVEVADSALLLFAWLLAPLLCCKKRRKDIKKEWYSKSEHDLMRRQTDRPVFGRRESTLLGFHAVSDSVSRSTGRPVETIGQKKWIEMEIGRRKEVTETHGVDRKRETDISPGQDDPLEKKRGKKPLSIETCHVVVFPLLFPVLVIPVRHMLFLRFDFSSSPLVKREAGNRGRRRERERDERKRGFAWLPKTEQRDSCLFLSHLLSTVSCVYAIQRDTEILYYCLLSY